MVIFDRSKKPILLTEAGRTLIEQIRFCLAHNLGELLKVGESRGLQGQLVVGIIPTIAPYSSLDCSRWWRNYLKDSR